MGLKDQYAKNAGTATPAQQADAPRPSLAQLRAKLSEGKTGGVNPPEASAAVPANSLDPRTGPNGESLTPAEPAASTAAATSTAEVATAPATEKGKGKGGRKPKAQEATPAPAQDVEVKTSGLPPGGPQGALLDAVRALAALVPAGSSIMVVGVG